MERVRPAPQPPPPPAPQRNAQHSTAQRCRTSTTAVAPHHDHAFVAAHKHWPRLPQPIHDVLLLRGAQACKQLRPALRGCGVRRRGHLRLRVWWWGGVGRGWHAGLSHVARQAARSGVCHCRGAPTYKHAIKVQHKHVRGSCTRCWRRSAAAVVLRCAVTARALERCGRSRLAAVPRRPAVYRTRTRREQRVHRRWCDVLRWCGVVWGGVVLGVVLGVVVWL